MQTILDDVASTPRGKEIVDSIDNRTDGRDTTIVPNDQGICRAVGKDKRPIRFDPGTDVEIITPSGPEKASPERLLAHELGHSLDPSLDDFNSLGETLPGGNIDVNENPVATALGQKPRIRRGP